MCREHVIAQKFINKSSTEIKEFCINGKPVGSVNRIPQDNKFGQLAYRRLAKTKLSKKDFLICSEISHTLKSKGLFFTGIDIIDGYLTEINVTSPTCIRETIS